jgi:hypothetical protein
VIIDEDDVYGDGVNIAARLEALADPWGVVISSAVFEQVRDRVPDSFEDLGDQQVKNIARSPIARRQKGRRYRYYVFGTLNAQAGTDRAQGWRLSAEEIEDAVIRVLGRRADLPEWWNGGSLKKRCPSNEGPTVRAPLLRQFF